VLARLSTDPVFPICYNESMSRSSSQLGFRIALGVLVITVIWAIWFIWQSNGPQVVQSAGNVQVYDQVPSDFPTGLWVDSSSPQHVDINKSGGTETETVIYGTDGVLPIVMGTVQKNLQQAGWVVAQTKISANSGFVTATKGSENMIVTFTSLLEKIQATFQYIP